MVTDLDFEHILVGLKILIAAIAQYGYVPLAIILVLVGLESKDIIYKMI